MRPSDDTYRPDIDGLRAIAVLAVVVFHASPLRLPGGFVGVDIFFVVSGFLISSIILRGWEGGTFSYWEFYSRRVRRIFPALIVVLLVIMAIGWVLLLPDEYRQLGWQVGAGALFSSNLLLWSDSSYFDSSAQHKPLLHLWSLGVEEQFYILWPLTLSLLWRWRSYRLVAIVSLATASFALNLWMSNRDATAAFYLPFTRFWELLFGAALAAWAVRPDRFATTPSGLFSSAERRAAVLGNACSLAGIALIAASITLLNRDVVYPSWYALGPSVGAALIIAAGPRAWFNRHVLSLSPIVFLGLISYPLYLWHWPLLSFLHIIETGDPTLTRTLRAAAVGVSFVLAAFTYWLIETPLRSRFSLRAITPRIVAAMLAVAVIGAGLAVANGVPARISLRNGMSSGTDFVWNHWTDPICIRNFPFDERFGWWFCRQSRDSAPTVLLLGNSHANALFPGMAGNARLKHHVWLSLGTCEPTLGIRYRVLDGNTENPCTEGRKKRQEEFLAGVISRLPSLKYILVSSSWPAFDEAGMELNPKGNSFYSVANETSSGTPLDEMLQGIGRQLDLLETTKAQLIFVLPTPYLPYSTRSCFSRPFVDATHTCETTVAEQHRLIGAFKARVSEALLARKHPVLIYDPTEVFCDADTCHFIRDGKPLLRDQHHLSEYGSAVVAAHFEAWAARHVPSMLQ